MVAVKVSIRATPVQIVQQFHTPSYDTAAHEGRELLQSISVSRKKQLLICS